MSVAMLLLAFAALPAGGAASTDDWPLTPERSLALEREHAEAAARFAATLDSVERMRNSYKGSKDPDAALAAWTAELDAAEPHASRSLNLNIEHRDLMGETDRFIVTWSLAYAKTKDRTYLESSPEYHVINARNKDMDTRTETLVLRLKEERQRREEAVALRIRERENEMEARLLYAATGIALAVLAGVAAYVIWRPKPGPPPPPAAEVIKLS